MKTRLFLPVFVVLTCTLSHTLRAQTTWNEVFNTFKLEARADIEWNRETVDVNGTSVGDPGYPYGIHGKYFNLILGGNLGNQFSYHFRQRLKADAGTINFFDNTDFLWLNYQITDHFRVRFGKDAMAVGGYEYDAPPIDEYITSAYWDNIYCFQLGASAAYTTQNGQHTFVGQVTQSPYVNSRRATGEAIDWNSGLLSYNIEWMGTLGRHISTLWSTSMIERDKGAYMNLTILGTRYVSTDGKVDIYLDLMHHALATDDWGKNFGMVFRWNYHLNEKLCLFIKSSYEQNKSEVDLASATMIDNLVPANHRYTKVGAGCEYYPTPSVRLHAYVADLNDEAISTKTTNMSLAVNMGATWTMDFKKLFKR